MACSGSARGMARLGCLARSMARAVGDLVRSSAAVAARRAGRHGVGARLCWRSAPGAGGLARVGRASVGICGVEAGSRAGRGRGRGAEC
jgi:hypothetical protein